MIYFIQSEVTNHIKIGFTESDDAGVRLATLQTGNANRLRLLGTIPGTLEDEKNLHRLFAAHRVNGEWFEPAPEVLAAVVAIQPLKCGDTEVVTQTVSIRVLTVGRKNFTKRLLDQLPERKFSPFSWLSFHRLEKEVKGWDEPDVSKLVNGNVWGWVAGDREEVTNYEGEVIRDEGGNSIRDNVKWIVFEKDGRLFKYKDFTDDRAIAARECMENSAIAYINRLRRKLPGFRDEDQLFIGV